MPSSAAAKGSHYKARTKAWLEKRGYDVAFLERMFLLHKPADKLRPGESPMIPIKRDQMGADLLAVSETEILFVQVQLGREHIAKRRAEFSQHRCPPPAKQWLVIWEKGGREPEVIDCTGGYVPVNQRPRREATTRGQTELW